MNKWADRLFLAGLVVVVILTLSWLPLAAHKHSMERIVGHKVSWWDAYWTSH